MRVIAPPPDTSEYKWTCTTCGAVIGVHKYEMTAKSADSYTTTCPICGKFTTVPAKSLVPV